MTGVRVTVANAGTNLATTVQTSGDGNYTVVNLLPGEYRVTVQSPGFKKAVTPLLTLLVNQILRADVTLEPGAVETLVEVSASGALIDTDSSTVGKVVENKEIVDLPLSSRNFMQLVTLSPGTVTDSGGKVGNEQRSFRSTLSGGAVWVGGARGASNAYMIDGVENNDPGFQTPAITPPIDAIQEFKLVSKNYGAEFGGSAAQINIAIKSGTNSFRGTAYDFFRNDVLNARNFFSQRDPITGRAKPQLRYNQFGGSLGGPVRIPKVLDGRNRLSSSRITKEQGSGIPPNARQETPRASSPASSTSVGGQPFCAKAPGHALRAPFVPAMCIVSPQVLAQVKKKVF